MIKQVLKNLSDENRKQLMYAFEEDLSLYLEFAPGKFIGVNLQDFTNLNVIETAGVWTYGEILCASIK